MGSLGVGNFDNDTALDLVCDIAKSLARETVVLPKHAEDIDLVMGAVAVRKTVMEHCHGPRPKREEIEELKAAVLARYDQKIDALNPKPYFKVHRREVIVQTFDEILSALAK